MSSFTRRIQSTLTRKMLKHRRGRHFMGRGSKLGAKNPRDPCATGKKKAPKPWRSKKNAALAKVKVSVAALPRMIDRAAIAQRHREKMESKAAARARLHASANSPQRVAGLLGTPAGINRHTSEPHRHERASGRRKREKSA